MLRRIFLINLFTAIGIIIYGIIKFLTFPVKKGRKIVNINIEDLNEGVNHFPKLSIIVLKDKNKFTVMSDICTHLGCKVKFEKDKKIFHCPCHKSEYSFKGQVLKGPAKKDLKKLNFKIINNKLKIVI